MTILAEPAATAGVLRFTVWMTQLKPRIIVIAMLCHVALCSLRIFLDVARISKCRTTYSHMEVPLG